MDTKKSNKKKIIFIDNFHISFHSKRINGSDRMSFGTGYTVAWSAVIPRPLAGNWFRSCMVLGTVVTVILVDFQHCLILGPYFGSPKFLEVLWIIQYPLSINFLLESIEAFLMLTSMTHNFQNYIKYMKSWKISKLICQSHSVKDWLLESGRSRVTAQKYLTQRWHLSTLFCSQMWLNIYAE